MCAPDPTAPAGADDAARQAHDSDDLAQLPPVLDPREEREDRPVVEHVVNETPPNLGDSNCAPRGVVTPGARFGRLVVVERAERAARRRPYWICRCDCGAQKAVSGTNLATGHALSCGCLFRDRTPDLTGRRVGRLVVEGAGARLGAWRCRCDCGARVVLATGSLVRTRPNQSCGCLRRERLDSFGADHTLHGHAGRERSPEYGSWIAMRKRCLVPSDPAYPNYGGRGITVCARWRDDFAAFLADMGPRPSRGHSIERRDNARGYDCGRCDDCRARAATPNCTWATRAEQARNTRRTTFLEIDGRRVAAAEVYLAHGIAHGTFWKRLHGSWDPLRAATTPVASPKASSAEVA